ncbi:MAG: GIY-YIG nuclease family protein [Bifidobacteriaceae bacterium]|nr:GIY-YIG nuclease family protein [Bifidobacteriaceae bacterium]
MGIYFLFGKDDKGSNCVYIGESENILERLRQHIGAYNRGKEDLYWVSAVCFTGRDLGYAACWPSADAGASLQTRLLLGGHIRFHRKYSHLNFGCPFFFVSRAPRFFFRRVVLAMHNEEHEH